MAIQAQGVFGIFLVGLGAYLWWQTIRRPSCTYGYARDARFGPEPFEPDYEPRVTWPECFEHAFGHPLDVRLGLDPGRWETEAGPIERWYATVFDFAPEGRFP